MDSATGNQPVPTERSMPVRSNDFFKSLHSSILEKENVLEVARNLPRHSLQEMSLIKVITVLCNNHQLSGLILRCKIQGEKHSRKFSRNSREWKDVLAVANELVSSICNSGLIQKKILDYLWPVCYNIMLWKSVYTADIGDEFLQYFYWTDQGKIDTTRTARRMIRNKNVPVRHRFLLGSNACLKEELEEIWPEMSNADREYFLTLHWRSSPLLLLWTRSLEGLYDCRVYVHSALVYALKTGLLEAVKYIFSMFSKVKRQYQAKCHMHYLLLKLRESLRLKLDEKGIGYFLFFEMSEEEQEKGFKQFIPLMWSLLLYSNEYKLCLSLLEEMIVSDSTEDLLFYLEVIFLKYNFEPFNDNTCGRLFMDVWRMIPASRRNSLTESELGIKFAPVLIRDHFPLVLENNASNTVTYTSLGQNYVNGGKWEFLQFLVEEEILETEYSFLRKRKMSILKALGVYDDSTWEKFVKFLRYIKCKNSD